MRRAIRIIAREILDSPPSSHLLIWSRNSVVRRAVRPSARARRVCRRLSVSPPPSARSARADSLGGEIPIEALAGSLPKRQVQDQLRFFYAVLVLPRNRNLE